MGGIEWARFDLGISGPGEALRDLGQQLRGRILKPTGAYQVPLMLEKGPPEWSNRRAIV